VLLTTYNHENWIAQAVDSTLMQETSFDYEVVIMEDCSTDSTREIVYDFQRRHPDKIRLILSEKNKNDNTSLVAAWQTSPSQYVALLDGDDYWTSPHKLQRQADFLDAYHKYAICYHNVNIIYEDGSQEPWHPGRFVHAKETSTLEDLLVLGNFVPGCSPMLRKGLFGHFPEWYNTAMWGDWPLYILNTQHGEKIGYIDELMGVYRVHSAGHWSRNSEAQQLQALIAFYRDTNRNVNPKYRSIVDAMIAKYSRDLALYRIRRIARRTLPVRVRRWLRALRAPQ
jgi:glycosyltransferase involved in cell wall biosynthesis